MARSQRTEERRRELVKAAFDCVAEKGFEGLRLRDVAARVGLDHSTVHHYFPGKQDLVTGIVDYATQQFWTPGAPVGDLDDHLGMLARLISERPALFLVLRELDLRATRDAEVRAIVESRERGWRDALAARVQPGHVELVIAVVKGVSLTPGLAGQVLSQLRTLLKGSA
ncbi:TetR/AcrR family transcriptional regulator [Nonomuraea typhae]|uniref:TetR/AcrR family transcriptional regulator n=1 Tax=Nonomuraea typhae TaxID=2603600 RepID=A0ABW7YR25_9ACTN